MPFIGTALMMAAFAGCGLPGFANFVGEITVFFGAWKVFPLVTVLALWGALIIGAVYMLRAVRDVLHGPLPEKWAECSGRAERSGASCLSRCCWRACSCSAASRACSRTKSSRTREKIVAMATVG